MQFLYIQLRTLQSMMKSELVGIRRETDGFFFKKMRGYCIVGMSRKCRAVQTMLLL
jgi:hypothetical protein